MLRVPFVLQPDAVTCLPSCIFAALQCQGHSIEYEDIEQICKLDHRGAVPDIAIAAIREDGWDVEEIVNFEITRLREAIDDGIPIVARVNIKGYSGEAFDHAVVVCDIAEDEVVYMDPQSSSEYQRLPLHGFNSFQEYFSVAYIIS